SNYNSPKLSEMEQLSLFKGPSIRELCTSVIEWWSQKGVLRSAIGASGFRCARPLHALNVRYVFGCITLRKDRGFFGEIDNFSRDTGGVKEGLRMEWGLLVPSYLRGSAGFGMIRTPHFSTGLAARKE